MGLQKQREVEMKVRHWLNSQGGVVGSGVYVLGKFAGSVPIRTPWLYFSCGPI